MKCAICDTATASIVWGAPLCPAHCAEWNAVAPDVGAMNAQLGIAATDVGDTSSQRRCAEYSRRTGLWVDKQRAKERAA